MRFTRVFFKSDDSITAIDVFPSQPGLICCANYSGRIFLYDYVRKVQVVENRLRLQKRRSSTSDTDIIETPHVSALAFSPDGRNLFCGLASGSVVALDPNVLAEIKTFSLTESSIVSIKFSPESAFVTVYVSTSSALIPLCNFSSAGRAVHSGVVASRQSKSGMDNPREAALPHKGHLRCVVHLAGSESRFRPQGLPKIDFSGPRPSEFPFLFRFPV